MGKGDGKGECCDEESQMLSVEGRQAKGAAIAVIIFEAIGNILMCFPYCALCHLPCGCCFGCWSFCSNIGSTFGAAMPLCCAQNSQGLMVMGSTSTASLVIRLLMMMILAIFIASYRHELQQYRDCKQDGGEDDECDEKIDSAFSNNSSLRKVIGWMIFGLVVSIVYIFVALLGTICGFKGFQAEEAAKRQNLDGTRPGTLHTPNLRGLSAQGAGTQQPIVVQGRAVSVQEPIIVQAQVISTQKGIGASSVAPVIEEPIAPVIEEPMRVEERNVVRQSL